MWLHVLVGVLGLTLVAITAWGLLNPRTPPAPTTGYPSPSDPVPTTPATPSPTPSPSPSPTPTPSPTPEGPQPEFAVATVVDLAHHTVPVPEGWTHSVDTIADEQAERLVLRNTAEPGTQLLFVAHAAGAFATAAEGADAVCNHHNQRLVKDLTGARVFERGGHLVSSNRAADVARCSALGVGADGVEYDYSWAVMWEHATPRGIVLLSQTDYALAQSGGLDESFASFYTCHFAHESGAAIEGCDIASEPSTIEPVEPPAPVQKPPFEVAQVVQVGKYSVPVPAGWTADVSSDPSTQSHLLYVENPSAPELKFAFLAQDPGPEADRIHEGGAGRLCGIYNKTLVADLKGDVKEMPALPLTWDSDDTTDVVVCGALGEFDDGIVYDYGWTAYWELEAAEGFIMRQRSNWAMYEADQIDPTLGAFYQCDIGRQAGANISIC